MISEHLTETDLAGVDGFHVHTLCDQGYVEFDRLLTATEERFGGHFPGLDWINLGGGQRLTAPDYDRPSLVSRLTEFSDRTGLRGYLEPGTAVALNAGALVTELLDVGWNGGPFAVLDASATCHMPDVIEAPYTPEVLGAEAVDLATAATDDPLVWQLGGPTCLAGDVIGAYRFGQPLVVGQRLVILDQAYYTLVKWNTFNGTPLPSVATWRPSQDLFGIDWAPGYDHFASRLGLGPGG